MAGVIGFDEMTGSELLDTVDALALEQRRIDVELVRAAAQWAAMHGEGTVDPEVAALPGREALRHYGGDGTPYVASFAGAVLGARLGKSTHAGEQLIATALDLQHRFPQLWSRVEALEVQVSYAQFVTRRTRELPREAAAYVDSRVAEPADGRITWSQFERLVEASIVAADPEASRVREEKARRQQFAHATRARDDGMGGFYLRTDIAGIARLDATVGHLAEALAALGATDDVDTRRAMAMVLLADPARAMQFLADYAVWKQQPAPSAPADQESAAPRPTIDWSALLPTVHLYLHCYGGDLVADGDGVRLVKHDETGIARIEGVGAVTEAWARHTLGGKARFVVRPVLDLEGQAPVQAWEIPDRHREAVAVMTPADVFPYASAVLDRTAGWRGMQIDHTVPWQPDDPLAASALGNYGPMTTFHHRVKTHGRWQVRQPFPGVYCWRDPYGALYLVDHTGTRRVRAAA